MTVPAKAILPSRRIAMLSHRLSTSAMSCVARTIVFPRAFSSRIYRWREMRPSTSSPAVGSSRNTMSGSQISASARWSRRFCPVDISWYRLPAMLPVSSAASMEASAVFRFHLANSSTASAPLMWAGNAADCSCIPILPFTDIVPPSYFLRPSIHARVVVFPAPFTPSSAKMSPRLTLRSIPFKTAFSP